ncbi:hypothetical protein, partial [Nonomuraea sp. bgisy101]|uniref:hypothetical protein n=1 Tax=Nonomuraea sp. bgisy101 TaxID=3413784 RepID=UPI003D75C366
VAFRSSDGRGAVAFGRDVFDAQGRLVPVAAHGVEDLVDFVIDPRCLDLFKLGFDAGLDDTSVTPNLRSSSHQTSSNT